MTKEYRAKVFKSGNSLALSSQPRLSARVRSSPSLSRPIRPERAIWRVVSPARRRTRT